MYIHIYITRCCACSRLAIALPAIMFIYCDTPGRRHTKPTHCTTCFIKCFTPLGSGCDLVNISAPLGAGFVFDGMLHGTGLKLDGPA